VSTILYLGTRFGVDVSLALTLEEVLLAGFSSGRSFTSKVVATFFGVDAFSLSDATSSL